MRLLKSRLLTMLAVAGLLAACSSGAAPGTTAAPETTTTTVAPTTTTTVPETTTTTAATTTTTTTTPPEDAELRIASFSPTITMTAPAHWAVEPRDPTMLGFDQGVKAGPGRYLVFSTDGPSTTDEWLEYLKSIRVELGEVTTVQIGSAPGFMVDARIRDDAGTQGCMDGNPCAELTSGWIIVEGFPNRIWVVDVDGKAVLIAAEAAEGGFDSFTEEVEQVLATLTWG